MAKSIRGTKKAPGRPKTITGLGTQIGARWQDSELSAIDDWRMQQADRPSRSEAIRRLVELCLAGPPKPQPRIKTGRAASDMAGDQIDRMDDKAATEEERASRKRRLIKGPKEFREMRGDQPKSRK